MAKNRAAPPPAADATRVDVDRSADANLVGVLYLPFMIVPTLAPA